MNTQDIRDALQQIRESAPEAPEPTFDELVAYREGRLPEEAEASLRERIVWSRTAVATLAAMGSAATDEESGPPVSEIELGAVRRLVRRDRQPMWSKNIASIAAALLLAVIGVATLGWYRAAEFEDQLESLRSPQPDIAIVELHSLLRSGDGQREKPIEVTTDRSTLFLMTTDPSDEYSGYRVELVDGDNQLVWRYDDLSRSDDGVSTFFLPAGAFAAGMYEVRLVGLSGDSSVILESSFVRLGTPP